MAVNTNMKEYISKFVSEGCTKDRTGVCNCGTAKPEDGMATYTSSVSNGKIKGVALER